MLAVHDLGAGEALDAGGDHTRPIGRDVGNPSDKRHIADQRAVLLRRGDHLIGTAVGQARAGGVVEEGCWSSVVPLALVASTRQ